LRQGPPFSIAVIEPAASDLALSRPTALAKIIGANAKTDVRTKVMLASTGDLSFTISDSRPRASVRNTRPASIMLSTTPRPKLTIS
jgi:hypothetical protein